MQIKQILRYQFVYVLLVILLVAAVIFNINTGNINISKDFQDNISEGLCWNTRI